MMELLREWDKFKYIKFDKDDEVFEFMRLAKINKDDMLKRFEAIGFYYGFISKEI